jgi:hypothetical protein
VSQATLQGAAWQEEAARELELRVFVIPWQTCDRRILWSAPVATHTGTHRALPFGDWPATLHCCTSFPAHETSTFPARGCLEAIPVGRAPPFLVVSRHSHRQVSPSWHTHTRGQKRPRAARAGVFLYSPSMEPVDLGALGESRPQEPAPGPQALAPHPEGKDSEVFLIAVFTLKGSYLLGPFTPKLSKKIKFMHQLGEGAPPLVGRPPENIIRTWVMGFMRKISGSRSSGGFSLLPDGLISATGSHVGLSNERAANGGGDFNFEGVALAPWHRALKERAREVAHHHHGSEIGEHARAAWWALEEGDVLNGTSRLLLAARKLSSAPEHGGLNSATLCGWIAEALEVCRLRVLHPDAQIDWVNANVDQGLPYDVLLTAPHLPGGRMEIDVKLAGLKMHHDPARPPKKPSPTREVGIEVDLGQSEALWRAGGVESAQRIVRVYAWAASVRP